MNESTGRTAAARTRPWDAADHLEDLEDVVAYLEAAFEDGDPRIVAAALGDVARSRGMTAVAAKAGVGRESLYKALSGERNPTLDTVLRLAGALGLKLRAEDAVRRQSATLRLGPRPRSPASIGSES